MRTYCKYRHPTLNLPFSPHTKNTAGLCKALCWAIPGELSFSVSMQDTTQFFLPAIPKLLSTWSLICLLKHSLEKKKNHLPLLGVQEYRWNLTHFRSYKTINSKKVNYLSFYASLCRLFLQHPAQDNNIQPCIFQSYWRQMSIGLVTQGSTRICFHFHKAQSICCGFNRKFPNINRSKQHLSYKAIHKLKQQF